MWFSLIYSLELYQQTNARLLRQGQKENVVIYHLVARGTIDEEVMRILKEKEKKQSDLIDALKAEIGSVCRKAVMGERNRTILREYNGKNLDKLRVNYGVSK